MTEPYVPHGTRLMVLKPGSILGAAEADVTRYKRNSEPARTGSERYAFHRVHVRRAMRKEGATGVDIIAAALADFERGRESGKPMTREIYRDEELLRQAIGESNDRVSTGATALLPQPALPVQATGAG